MDFLYSLGDKLIEFLKGLGHVAGVGKAGLFGYLAHGHVPGLKEVRASL